MGDDTALLDVLSSANLACGFHADDPLILQRTVEFAMARGVDIGVHVGFPDRQGFGRRVMQIDITELDAIVWRAHDAYELSRRARQHDRGRSGAGGRPGAGGCNLRSETDPAHLGKARAIYAVDVARGAGPFGRADVSDPICAVYRQ